MRLVHLMTGAAMLLPVAAMASETIAYGYDARGRLIAVTHSGSVNNGVATTYAYDRADNRTNRTTSSASAPIVADWSFESPSIGGSYIYRPTATGATFTGNAGLNGNGGAFGFTAPDGVQVAFLQTDVTSPAVVSLSVSGLSPGANYAVRFKLQARPGFGGNAITVSFGGTNLGTFGGPTSFQTVTSATFQATASTGTVSFTGQYNTTADYTTGIDAVEIVPI